MDVNSPAADQPKKIPRRGTREYPPNPPAFCAHYLKTQQPKSGVAFIPQGQMMKNMQPPDLCATTSSSTRVVTVDHLACQPTQPEQSVPMLCNSEAEE